MPCIVALVIFSVLGIFSAAHRRLAKEAFFCVFRRMTFRPCNSDFNQKIKAQITGKLLGRSVTAARILNRHFELISWVLVILTIGSGVYTAKGAYNFYIYGSCAGLNESGLFCPFDPAGESNAVSQIGGQCVVPALAIENLKLEKITLGEFPLKNPGAKNSVVFIGCYNCGFTRRAYPLIERLVEKNETSYTFIHFPAKAETDHISNYTYCAYRQNPEKFWQLNDLLFASDETDLVKKEYVHNLSLSVGLDEAALTECIFSPETQRTIDGQFRQIQEAGVYGTPTIFINGKPLVGPKPYRVYQRMLDKSL